MRGLLLAAVLLLAFPAQADWLRNCQAGQTSNQLVGGGFACHNPTGASNSPSLLDVSQCTSVDMFLFNDITDSGTPSTGTFTVWTCPVLAAGSVTTTSYSDMCEPILNGGTGSTLNGTVNEVEAYGAVRLFFFADGNTSTKNQLLVRCAQAP